jgi:hypothetical protein
MKIEIDIPDEFAAKLAHRDMDKIAKKAALQVLISEQIFETARAALTLIEAWKLHRGTAVWENWVAELAVLADKEAQEQAKEHKASRQRKSAKRLPATQEGGDSDA